MSRDKRIEICSEETLKEQSFLAVPILYRNQPESGIVFRLHGQVYAYLNRCVHMPRRLNCERNTIFDDTGNHLRCSMHGIVYDPCTGESISTMCNGEKLTRIKVSRLQGKIYFDDKRVKPHLRESS